MHDKINMVDFEVYLQGGSPWGFRLQGGREFRMPIRIAKVKHLHIYDFELYQVKCYYTVHC